MENIVDFQGRLVCKGDPSTGFIESLYKGNRTTTILSIGNSITFERQNIKTTVERNNKSYFSIKHLRKE